MPKPAAKPSELDAWLIQLGSQNLPLFPTKSDGCAAKLTAINAVDTGWDQLSVLAFFRPILCPGTSLANQNGPLARFWHRWVWRHPIHPCVAVVKLAPDQSHCLQVLGLFTGHRNARGQLVTSDVKSSPAFSVALTDLAYLSQPELFSQCVWHTVPIDPKITLQSMQAFKLENLTRPHFGLLPSIGFMLGWLPAAAPLNNCQTHVSLGLRQFIEKHNEKHPNKSIDADQYALPKKVFWMGWGLGKPHRKAAWLFRMFGWSLILALTYWLACPV